VFKVVVEWFIFFKDADDGLGKEKGRFVKSFLEICSTDVQSTIALDFRVLGKLNEWSLLGHRFILEMVWNGEGRGRGVGGRGKVGGETGYGRGGHVVSV